jgi:hypothetical protein
VAVGYIAGGTPVYPVKTTDLPSVAGGTPVYPVKTTDLPSVAGGNRCTQWKPPTCRQSLTNFITTTIWNTSDRNSSCKIQWKKQHFNGFLKKGSYHFRK